MTFARQFTSLLVGATIVVSLGACGIGGPEISSRARCDGPAFTSDTMPAAPMRTLVLVDLPENGESAGGHVVDAIDPVLSRAVVEGGVVRLLISGGEGQPLSPSPCLDGGSAIMVERNNDETERRSQSAAVEAIEGNVLALLAETEVSSLGDLSNLLAAIPAELRSLSGAGGTGDDGPIRVVLISDLTSPAARGDCLSLDGVRASSAVADAMVVRCLETRQFQRLPAGVAMTIVRPQLLPGDNAGTRMSGYLMASLCARMTKEKGGCISESAEGG
ncbi:MAG TPA: hypothetical protein VNP96_02760 [Solirubrobacterales bacterium]|nr:hypothetical protein [Solirubrobacterales bacterium]